MCTLSSEHIPAGNDVLAIDMHVYRLSRIWGWIPANANREQAQRHLDARLPDKLK